MLTMQITCPSCGNACEIDGEISVGQHLLCPFCSQTFSYSGVKQEDETVSRDIQPEEDIPEGIPVKCPYCGTEYEVDKSSEGVSCQCGVCNKEFVAKRFVLPRRRKQRISISADSLRSMVPTGASHLNPRRNVRSRVLKILCVLLVAGGLGVLIYKTMENSKGEATNDGAEARNDHAEAKNGSPEEQYNSGMQYYKGEGVAQDRTEAVRLFRKAAEQGHAKAQTILGLCYGMGEGVSQDKKEALRWIRKAAEQGYSEAQYALGACYANGLGVMENHEVAVQWYRKAAEQGLASAQNALGKCFYEGNGVWQSQIDAVKWFRKAAEQGYAEAQYNLGMRYLLGEGVKRDGSEAGRLLEEAAEQGYAEAQYQLGMLCDFEGAFVEGKHGRAAAGMSYRRAMIWYRKAAEQGHKDAMRALQRLGREY